MIINTSQEQALVDCCPCSIPTCASPRLSCESIQGYAYLTGELPSHIYFPEDAALFPNEPFDSDDFKMYKTLRFNYEDEESSGWEQLHKDSIVSVAFGGVGLVDVSPTFTITSSDPAGAGEWHEVPSNPVTVAESRAIAHAAIEAALDFDDPEYDKGNECSSSSIHPSTINNVTYDPLTLNCIYSRYKYGVPDGIFFPKCD